MDSGRLAGETHWTEAARASPPFNIGSSFSSSSTSHKLDYSGIVIHSSPFLVLRSVVDLCVVPGVWKQAAS